jgi:FKBP-type peptidyl-prolyl cis-trans isomerase 2
MLHRTMKRIIPAVSALLVIVSLLACSPAKVAQKKVVDVSYTLTVDGAVFDKSQEGQPLEFMVGAGKMMPAFETAIIGLKTGDKKTFDIKAADAYGPYDKAKLIEVPLANFPAETPPKVGDHFSVKTSQGALPVSIAAVNGKTVTVDMNSPLAGKDLSFAVEIVKIREATKAELAELLAPTQGAPQASPPAGQ